MLGEDWVVSEQWHEGYAVVAVCSSFQEAKQTMRDHITAKAFPSAPRVLTLIDAYTQEQAEEADDLVVSADYSLRVTYLERGA